AVCVILPGRAAFLRYRPCTRGGTPAYLATPPAFALRQWIYEPARGNYLQERSDRRPDFRCRQRKHISGREGANRWCHTNCRNALGKAPSASSYPGSLPDAPRYPECLSNQNPPLRLRRADTGRYSSARFDELHSVWDLPENCREGANGPRR